MADLKPWVTVLGCVVFVANLLSLLFWLWTDRLHSIGPSGIAVNSYDAISLQISVLGIIITAMAIGLGVASIFGYQVLRDSMAARAEELLNARLDAHPLFAEQLAAAAPANSQPAPAVPQEAESEEVSGDEAHR